MAADQQNLEIVNVPTVVNLSGTVSDLDKILTMRQEAASRLSSSEVISLAINPYKRKLSAAMDELRRRLKELQQRSRDLLQELATCFEADDDLRDSLAKIRSDLGNLLAVLRDRTAKPISSVTTLTCNTDGLLRYLQATPLRPGIYTDPAYLRLFQISVTFQASDYGDLKFSLQRSLDNFVDLEAWSGLSCELSCVCSRHDTLPDGFLPEQIRRTLQQASAVESQLRLLQTEYNQIEARREELRERLLLQQVSQDASAKELLTAMNVVLDEQLGRVLAETVVFAETPAATSPAPPAPKTTTKGRRKK